MTARCLWIGFATLFFVITHSRAQEGESRPNILFLMGDDHTSQAWGMYGSVIDEFAPNRNLKQLAQQGCLMRQMFCTNSICVPSRATILTGQYSHRNEVRTLSDPLPKGLEHLGVQLQRGGYQTAILGKWHLKTQPYGFDDFNVLRGQGRYFNPVLSNASNWEDKGVAHEGFSTDVIAELAVDWLRERDDEKPFFLMCHFKATHEPFQYPERFQTLYENQTLPEPISLLDGAFEKGERTFEGQVLEILQKRYASDKRGIYPGSPWIAAGDDAPSKRRSMYQKFIKDFLRSSAAVDENIGRVLSALKELGLEDNTLVVVTSDQGYFLGEHGCFDKRMMLEESARMPCLVRFPGEIPEGTETLDLCLNIDFAPTILDYAGLEIPSDMQGTSFRQALQGEATRGSRDAIYYRYFEHQKQRPAHFGIRTDRDKLIFYYGMSLGLNGTRAPSTQPSWEYYDLEKDPKERVNRIHESDSQERIEELKQCLRELREEFGDTDSAYPELLALLKEQGL